MGARPGPGTVPAGDTRPRLKTLSSRVRRGRGRLFRESQAGLRPDTRLVDEVCLDPRGRRLPTSSGHIEAGSTPPGRPLGDGTSVRTGAGPGRVSR